MHTTISIQRRRDAVARLLKILLQDYPEHVIAQAIRQAAEVLSADPGSAHRAIQAAEQLAQARMAGTPKAGPEAA
jgi:hypothetical protein